MELMGIMLNEISQGRQKLYELTYMWSLKKKFTDTENRLVFARDEEWDIAGKNG